MANKRILTQSLSINIVSISYVFTATDRLILIVYNASMGIVSHWNGKLAKWLSLAMTEAKYGWYHYITSVLAKFNLHRHVDEPPKKNYFHGVLYWIVCVKMSVLCEWLYECILQYQLNKIHYALNDIIVMIMCTHVYIVYILIKYASIYIRYLLMKSKCFHNPYIIA